MGIAAIMPKYDDIGGDSDFWFSGVTAHYTCQKN
jgi:hypothetical protein